MTSNYIEQHLPPSVTQQLEAGAFRSLCNHLKERSDEVQNIDLMTVSGFCRNCMAKWMVVEARRLSMELEQDSTMDKVELNAILQGLDALGYDEAAQYVYGCDYADWKKAHTTNVSKEQMELYDKSKPLRARHDESLLATKGQKPARPYATTSPPPLPATCAKPSLLSNVCCEDVDEYIPPPSIPIESKSTSRTVPPFTPPAPPGGGVQFTCAILTISDRAYKNEYESGDLSGPAVEEAVMAATVNGDARLSCRIVSKAIVPDDVNSIQTKLKEYATQGIDLVLTTGGTGFAPRDVTPEATVDILDRPLPGLMSFVTTECSHDQPLSSLSRGTAGIREKTLIINLPGNPKGVREIIPLLLPIVVHGIKDMQLEG